MNDILKVINKLSQESMEEKDIISLDGKTSFGSKRNKTDLWATKKLLRGYPQIFAQAIS